MANTYRKTTASPISGRESLADIPKERYRHNTANPIGRQGRSEIFPGALEVLVPRLASAAKTAAALHAQCGGSTVSVSGGNMAGLPRFAVSIYPERTLKLAVVPTWEVLFAFAVVNADLLLLPDHALGTWFDGGRNLHILDVAICSLSLREAILLGIRCRQRAIYDLRVGKEILLASGRGISTTHFSEKER